MPKVFIEYSDAEKAALNLEGRQRGCLECPVCNDCMNWKPFHETVFEESRLVAVGKGKNVLLNGHHGLSVMCQECWEKTLVEERIKHYQDFFERELGSIKPVAKRMTHKGDLKDDLKDSGRHERERQMMEARHSAILDCVRKGL